jgi:hypothetical protein
MKRDVFDFRAVGEKIYILRITTKFLNLGFNRYTLIRKKRKRQTRRPFIRKWNKYMKHVPPTVL